MTAEINKTSGRKRTVFHCGELYKNAEEGNYNIQLAWNEEITAEKWNSLKRTIPRTSRIAYRFNEYKIIILVDLRPAGDDYIKRFYKNSDLVTTLVNRKKGSNIRISPDFNRLTDVVTVEDPSRLLAVYQESCARLVIVGDALSEIYQKALAEVKRYDRYARFMLAVNIDQAKIDYFLSQIKLNYHRNNW
ncbi:MAG TPA: hypothetical protein DC049_16435 [Spirochaetia bacterium]|nr:hypothetical protein [Spirochaetia bacterium]